MYSVVIKKSVLKTVAKMPERIQMKLRALTDDLETDGPIRDDWPNYSKLGPNEFHCHLSHK
jgi:mRNA-degrading endonuclease RelE of RelBE toxin-antitoxin system